MRISQIFIIIICIAFTISSGNSQPESGMPQEDGKCFAKCIINPTLVNTNTKIAILPLFDNPMYSTKKEIVIHPASQKWIKKPSVKGCTSPDPNDCLVWCLEEKPERTEQITIKTVGHKFYESYLEHPNNYETTTLTNNVIQKGSGHTEWKEVICEDHPRYDEITTEVLSRLEQLGYDKSHPNSPFEFHLKSNLSKYQKANQLPIGNLDMETLHWLGVPGYVNPNIDNDVRDQPLKMNEVASQDCYYQDNFRQYSVVDTLDFKSTVYTGTKVKKLNYVDYINLSKVSSYTYDSNNPRHAVVLDSKYDKLYSKLPQDFTDRDNTVIYYRVIRPGGTESFDCLCPNHPDIIKIQSDVEIALVGKGYQVDNTFSETTKRSLAQFQLKHNRPIGVLDFETLELLGVEY